jgi:hypothetical protein
MRDGLVVIIALAATAVLGCGHRDADRIMMYVEASYEGGNEIALLHQRVWGRHAGCESVAMEDNELWVTWAHTGQPEQFGDAFMIGDHVTWDEAFVVASDDGILVYYSFGDFAELADRFGNLKLELGAGRRSAAFHTPDDLMVVESVEGLMLVDLDEMLEESLGVSGVWPSFSPDGQQLTYARDGEAWVLDRATDTEWSLGEAFWPRYLDDGCVAAWRDGQDGPGLYEADVELGVWEFAGAADSEAIGAPWWRLAPDGERILVDDGSGGFTLQSLAGASESDWSMTSELWCE